MTHNRESQNFRGNIMNGYSYQCEKTKENNNTILSHMVVMPNGDKESIPWTPNMKMDEDDFKLWIHLGMPKDSVFDKNKLIEYLNSSMN